MGASAAIETTLLTYDGTPSAPAELGLWRADGQHRAWEIPAGVAVAIGADEDGFLVVQRATYGIGPGEGRLISVGLDGSMTVGRVLPDVPAHGAVAMDPPRMFDGEGGVQSIRPDLTLGRSAPCPVEGLGVTVAGRWLAVVHHDETRPLGDNRRYWMLSLFDSGTLARSVSVEVATPTLGLAVDGAGVVWISDGGVRTVPLGTGDRQIRLDLRELDGGARTTRPPDRPSSG